MPTVGHILKEAREKRGLSLSEAAHETKIKLDYLDHMEADQFDRLIAPAYARSFLKMYADFLGLNSKSLIEQMRAQQRPATSHASSSTTSKPVVTTSPKPAPSTPTKSAPTAPPKPAPAVPHKPVPPSPTKSTADHPTKPAPITPAKPAPADEPSKSESLPSAKESRKPLKFRGETQKSVASSAAEPAAAVAPAKPSPLPSRPPSLEPRPLPLKAVLVSVVVVAVVMWGVVFAWKRMRTPAARSASTPAAVELTAGEQIKVPPAHAADTLDLPRPR